MRRPRRLRRSKHNRCNRQPRQDGQASPSSPSIADARLLRRHGVACEVVSDAAQWNMIGHAVAEARKRDYKTASKVRVNHLDWWLDEIKWIKGRLLPNGQLIREFAEYAAVERTSRGSALQAPARQIVWDGYQSYQSQLLAAHQADWDDFAHLAIDHYRRNRLRASARRHTSVSQAARRWRNALTLDQHAPYAI